MWRGPRYPLGVTILLLALLALFFSVGSMSSSSSVTATPALTMESTFPLVVRGTSFRAGEKVTVTAFTGVRPRSVTVRSAKGTFRASLPVSGKGCGAARFVRARGDKGSVATLSLGGGICVPPPRR